MNALVRLVYSQMYRFFMKKKVEEKKTSPLAKQTRWKWCFVEMLFPPIRRVCVGVNFSPQITRFIDVIHKTHTFMLTVIFLSLSQWIRLDVWFHLTFFHCVQQIFFSLDFCAFRLLFGKISLFIQERKRQREREWVFEK